MEKEYEAESFLKEMEKVKLPTFKEIIKKCTEPCNDFISIQSRNLGYSLTQTGEKTGEEISKCLMPIHHEKFANLVFERYNNFSVENYAQKIKMEEYLETAAYLLLGEIKKSYTKGI